MLAVLVLCLVAFAAAQRPVPCVSPQQWEGRIHDFDEKQQWRVDGRISYDSIYRRERVVDEVDEATGRDFFDIVSLFDSKIEFIYNFRAHNCSRREITRAWRDFGIRPNDTSYGEAFIGSSGFPGAGVLVTIWGGNFTTPQNETISHITTWTYQGCIPVSRTSFGQTLGIAHLSFYDVTLGIRDPNVFTPRRECLSDYEWENRHTLFGL